MKRTTLSLAILAATAAISTTTPAYPQVSVRTAPFGARAANSPNFGNNRYTYFGLGYGYGSAPGAYGWPPFSGYHSPYPPYPYFGYGFGYGPGGFGAPGYGFGGYDLGGYGYGGYGYGGLPYPYLGPGYGSGARQYRPPPANEVYVGYNAPPYQFPGTRNGYARRQSDSRGVGYDNDPGQFDRPSNGGGYSGYGGGVY